MPRRARKLLREPVLDSRYQNITVSKLINRMMKDGKKSTAEKIVYGAMESIEQSESKPALSVLELAVRNATPQLEVKGRRVGGATYQVPVEVPPGRALTLAMRWLVASATARSGKSMAEKLAGELADASKGQGATIKKRDDTHKMAEANRAFAHYRW
jgi:small subunit ribosomal protein S7